MSVEKQIPYKIYLEENELPKSWYNVRADISPARLNEACVGILWPWEGIIIIR